MPRRRITRTSLQLLLFILVVLLRLTEHLIHAQRTRFTFGSFQLRFVVSGVGDTCSSGKDGGGGDGVAADTTDTTVWDETAENIRSGAEACLRTVKCAEFDDQTPFFVGLGNVECVVGGGVTDGAEGDDVDSGTITIAFVGGGAMDFNTNVPHNQNIVEQCVMTVLQSSECFKIYSTYYAPISSPATFTGTSTTSWRSTTTSTVANDGGGSTTVDDKNVHSSKEEDHSSNIISTTTDSAVATANSMSRPFSVLSGTCSAAVVVAFVIAFFFYRRRLDERRNNNKINNKKGLSGTEFDIEVARGFSGLDDGRLLSADSLVPTTSRQKSGELSRMLDDQKAVALVAKGDRDTPTTTTKEADSSFGTTSTSHEDNEEEEADEEQDDDGVEVLVGLSSSANSTTNVGPVYDTRHVTDSSSYCADSDDDTDDDDDRLPVIVIPHQTTTATVDEPLPWSNFCAPFAVDTRSDDDAPLILTMTGSVVPSRDETCETDHLPELGQSSDYVQTSGSVGDDSHLVDLHRYTNATTNTDDDDYDHNGTSYESMVEVTSDEYESTINIDETYDGYPSSSSSASSSEEGDREFEPDAYWDPDDNSLSTADAAGLVAMGTGEFSFQPSTVTGAPSSASSSTGLRQSHTTTTVTDQLNNERPPPLFHWFCQGPATLYSTTSSSSLPSLAKQEQPGSKDQQAPRQRTKSFCGGGFHQLS